MDIHGYIRKSDYDVSISRGIANRFDLRQHTWLSWQPGVNRSDTETASTGHTASIAVHSSLSSARAALYRCWRA